MLNFGISKPRVKGGLGPQAPLDPHLNVLISKMDNTHAMVVLVIVHTICFYLVL